MKLLRQRTPSDASKSATAIFSGMNFPRTAANPISIPNTNSISIGLARMDNAPPAQYHRREASGKPPDRTSRRQQRDREQQVEQHLER